jgi:hypothetical protein
MNNALPTDDTPKQIFRRDNDTTSANNNAGNGSRTRSFLKRGETPTNNSIS